ncbi:MFS multidrug transporter [Aspergillus sclerotialis]|uniref:MFS multidrug transporter n=1 Tax=Aspergillus sclerotialis TaxID=2070753 RepID=A0A3A2ZFB6_9EURO|nr:MFS multidrug transporter [Aspergillus sclerotialis]
MSRGFAGSFGSAAGGGLFSRELKGALERGFSRHGLTGKEELIRKLIGSPALVMNLTGAEREVAVNSYEKAVQRLFLAAGALTLATTIVQAGTGKNPPKGKERQEIFEETGDI